MGIYDRDYYQEQRPDASFRVKWPQTVVGTLILINVAVWLLDFLSPEQIENGRVVGRWLSDHLAVHVDTIQQPWLWWQFLTAGFTHSPLDFQHILFNMLVLFFLGRDVEAAYGRNEFLCVYLAMLVFASVVWNATNLFAGTPGWQGAYGASGAIAGVVILFALNFPRATLLLFFVIPIPAWLFGVIVVIYDMIGATGQGGQQNVAYSMHLAGAAFALAYYQFGWKLSRFFEGRFGWLSFRRKPRLKVHTPEDSFESSLNDEVDRILEKIHREGEASLTSKERKTLEAASREYQRRKTTSGRR